MNPTYDFTGQVALVTGAGEDARDEGDSHSSKHHGHAYTRSTAVRGNPLLVAIVTLPLFPTSPLVLPCRDHHPIFIAGDLSVAVIRSALMSNAVSWASTAGNKFREVARSTDPTTKLLAEGLTALTEALRELDDRLRKIDQRARSTPER